MDKLAAFFQIKERGSSFRTEILAGMTTFVTMAYILIIQPKNMGAAGMDAVGILLMTALLSGAVTIIMGIVSNMPFALAPGLGSSAILANAIVIAGVASWETGLGMVFISGTVFLVLSIFGIRETVARTIPKNLKIGISAGIGIFIIRIALVSSKLVQPNFKGFGELADPSVRLAAIGLVLCLVLNFFRFSVGGKIYRFRGGLFAGIVITTIAGIFTGVVKIPPSLFTSGAFSAMGNVAFKLDIPSAFRIEYIAFMLAFFISDFFSTLGTSLGLANNAGMMDENGDFPGIGKVFLVDAVGTVSGALLGLSTVTTYVESASGVEVGGRTGFASIVTGLLFISAIFFAPLFLMIPNAATAPALVIIGISMMSGLRGVDFTPVSWTPVAVLIIGTLFGGTGKGIALGLAAFCIVGFAHCLFTRGQDRENMPSIFTIVMAILTFLQFII